MPKSTAPWLFYEYLESKEIAAKDRSFYGLMMAMMRKADTTNERKLRSMWPDVWDELQARYNAPGGALNETELGFVTHLQAVQ